jgi:type I restriction enzyme S subunit
MSKLDELIAELCPDGVEYRKLKDVTEMQRGTSLTKKNATEGIYPVISGGTEPAFYCDSYNRENETITVAGSGVGAGYVQYWNEPIFVCDAFSIKGKEGNLTKYIYYCLSNMQDKIFATKTGGGIPHVYISSIENFVIPLPPLPVQREIVRILDKFTELTTELTTKLTTELEARKKQYEYYREKLLTFGDDVPRAKLADVADICRGVRVVKKQLMPTGLYPVYQNSLAPMGYYDKHNCDANTTFVISAGAAGEVGFCDKNFWAADDCLVFSNLNGVINKYIYYFLMTKQDFIFSNVRKASVPRLSRTVIENMQIPLLPLEEQQRIVSILDRFDSLCNDISAGLPAEIEARQKQYEYYRDKLLTFKELGS